MYLAATLALMLAAAPVEPEPELAPWIVVVSASAGASVPYVVPLVIEPASDRFGLVPRDRLLEQTVRGPSYVASGAPQWLCAKGRCRGARSASTSDSAVPLIVSGTAVSLAGLLTTIAGSQMQEDPLAARARYDSWRNEVPLAGPSVHETGMRNLGRGVTAAGLAATSSGASLVSLGLVGAFAGRRFAMSIPRVSLVVNPWTGASHLLLSADF